MKTFVFVLKILYFPIKCFPKQDKVVLISRQSNSVSLDFLLLSKRLRELAPDMRVVILPKKLEGSLFHKIGYGFHMLRQMYHIATSRVVVLDGYCIVASVLKHRKNTKIVQMWHALGAVKKFGYQALGTKEGSSPKVAEIMKMHRNYDVAFCASAATARFFSEAFQMPLTQFEILGMPRVDYIQRKENRNQELFDAYPKLRRKKNILYIPTFRKDIPLEVSALIKEIDESRYNLIIRTHPLEKADVSEAFLISRTFSTYDLIKVADYIITDYSAAAIEASILNKPLFFYVYDYERYENDRGFNIDVFSEMPDASYRKAKEIIRKIESGNYDFKALKCFREKYVETLGFCNTDRISKKIMELAKES